MAKPVTIGDLRGKTFAKPSYLLYPWLPEGGLTMLHSWRGIGKTFFALAVGQAVASSSYFLKWPANPGAVLYFDCEMGEARMLDRWNLVDKAASFPAADSAFRLFTFEHMGGRTWNLADPFYQKKLGAFLIDVKFLIIDNLTAACRPVGREDFKAAYYRFRDWLLAVASTGRAVLILHHSGKSGAQRGISDIEDPLDVVLQLRRPEDWTPIDGSKFELHFEKARGIDPIDVTAQEPILIDLISHKDGIKWLWSPLYQAEAKKKQDAIKWEGDSDEVDLF